MLATPSYPSCYIDVHTISFTREISPKYFVVLHIAASHSRKWFFFRYEGADEIFGSSVSYFVLHFFFCHSLIHRPKVANGVIQSRTKQIAPAKRF